ncbi:MAG TPA: flavin reductase [Pelobium sp.]
MATFNSADILAMDASYRTTFINSISGFKSLQMVATKSKNGSANIALFNSIFHVGANPPYLGFVLRPHGGEHETMINILETKHYTINNVVEQHFMAAHQTSARYKAGESEFKACGFTEEYVAGFNAPFIKEANIKIGLAFKEFLPVLLNNTKIVIGEIKHISISEDFIAADGFVDLVKAQSVTCAGLDAYYTANLLGRLNYAKPEKHPSFLNVNK